MTDTPHRGMLIASGCLLGAGLGGFLDGIVLHQLLQWHHLLSSRIAPDDVASIKVNMFWDGVFHAFTWLMTAAGLALLVRYGQHRTAPFSGRSVIGSLALGWGLFNLIEGAVDHQVLALHHVHPGANELAWDLGFLAFGAGLAIAGIGLIRAGRRDEARGRSDRPARRILTPSA